MIRITTVSWIALSAILAIGCSDPPEPQTPDSTGAQSNQGPASTGSGDDAGPVGIDERIVKMCNLPEAHFDFDSASVSPTAKSMLDKLAECFLSGPAKGKGMRIVGHADPRGETEYNFALGQRRAGSIAGYLNKAGLSEERVATSSRGELDASGSEESGWARDRKVEIVLAE
jgi:peptidoglycan-associated lipoprotein